MEPFRSWAGLCGGAHLGEDVHPRQVGGRSPDDQPAPRTDRDSATSHNPTEYTTRAHQRTSEYKVRSSCCPHSGPAQPHLVRLERRGFFILGEYSGMLARGWARGRRSHPPSAAVLPLSMKSTERRGWSASSVSRASSSSLCRCHGLQGLPPRV